MGKPKSAEWKAKIQAINAERRLARATPEQQAAFEALFGTRITNWDEIQIQNNREDSPSHGWPRLRMKLAFDCVRCGRATTKVMTPELLKFPTRTNCHSCAGGVGVTKTCDQMNTEEVRARVRQAVEDGRKGPGTPENDRIRQQIELTIGTTVTNWDELQFSRYGNPTKNSWINFVCQCCKQSSKLTFVNVNSLPNFCQKCVINESFSGVSRSGPEVEIENFLRSIGEDNILVGQRTIIPPRELDIFLPDRKLAIEYHGLYYHSGKSKFYHLSKLRDCEKLGIRLIQIFEDEWKYKGEIVRNRLTYILGKSDSKRIHGRECEIREISVPQAKDFLESTHIQGSGGMSEQYGAFFEDQLVAVMTFRPGRSGAAVHGNDWWILNRFSVVRNVPGIASRLLAAFTRKHPTTSVVSYADRRWSDGGVYESMGFTMLHETQPQYWYIMGNKRLHKSAFKKKELVGKGYDVQMSESEITEEAGYLRIWDCGNLVFRLDPKPT
jgi:ribosomal protein L44E